MQLRGRGQHHGSDAVGLGARVRGEVQRRTGVAVDTPADADTQQHRHDQRGRREPQPRNRGCVTAGSWTAALSVCRSAISACRSPSVTALVAVPTRCRCSSAESWPSFSASSRIWQASCRSLSLARVVAVVPLPSGAPSHFATRMIVEVRRAGRRRRPCLRIGGGDGDVLW